MTFTVRYLLNDAEDGESRTYAAERQDLIEAHIEPFIAAGTLVQATVYDSAGVMVAESRALAPGLRAVPGTAGWVDGD